MVKCKECGAEISSLAVECPKCGRKAGPNKNVKTFSLGCGGLLVVIVIVVIAVSSGGSKKSEPPAPAPVVEKPDTAENKDPAMVFFASRMFMEKRLKAPASAKWPEYGDEGTAAGYSTKTGRWVVMGHVDAQNSFGALIRTLYVMELEYLPGEGWRVFDVSTGER